jgi:aconitate hydratase
MLPFVIAEDAGFEVGDYVFVPGIKKAVEEKTEEIKAYIVNKGMKEISLTLGDLTDDERQIISKGCLINFNRQ